MNLKIDHFFLNMVIQASVSLAIHATSALYQDKWEMQKNTIKGSNNNKSPIEPSPGTEIIYFYDTIVLIWK